MSRLPSLTPRRAVALITGLALGGGLLAAIALESQLAATGIVGALAATTLLAVVVLVRRLSHEVRAIRLDIRALREEIEALREDTSPTGLAGRRVLAAIEQERLLAAERHESLLSTLRASGSVEQPPGEVSEERPAERG